MIRFNLGLVYFTDWKERMSYEQINAAFPKLIPGMVSHEGIGFIMVRSEENGAMVIGEEGVYYLEDDRIEGVNPLENFGPRAAQHLRRQPVAHLLTEGKGMAFQPTHPFCALLAQQPVFHLSHQP